MKHSFCTENAQEYNKDWQQCRNKVISLKEYNFIRAQKHPWTQAMEEPVNTEEREANVNKMHKILHIPVASYRC